MLTVNNNRTRADVLVQELMQRIVSGQWAIDQVLPPERELAEQLGVSRPTLREALRQLERLGLLLGRQGSGTRVCNWRETATIDIFPAYLQSAVGTPSFFLLLESSLRVRVAPILESIRWLARPNHKVNYIRLRQELAEVWRLRDQPVQFVVRDFEWMKALFLAAEYYPALWVMNAFVANYVKVVADLGVAAPAPLDYFDVWNAILDACKAGAGETAANLTSQYFERHDHALLEFLGRPKT